WGCGVLDELTAAGCARRVVAADAGYGDNTAFRQELTDRGWQYVVAVKGTTSAHPHDAAPETMNYGGRGRPPVPRYRTPPANLRPLAPAPARPIQPPTRGPGPTTAQAHPAPAPPSRFLALPARPPHPPRPPTPPR